MSWWVPTESAAVSKLALPSASATLEARVLVPSRKSTSPVGAGLPAEPATVAVSVSGWPKTVAFGERATETVATGVGTGVTGLSAASVAAPVPAAFFAATLTS